MALLWALTAWLATQPASAIETGQRVQWQTMQLLGGQTISPTQLEGRYVFLQVWASWCPYCKLQNANLPELQRRWESRGGVFITMASDKNDGALRTYLAQHRYTFPVIPVSAELRQWLGKTRTVPVVLIIGPEGSVLKKIEGQMLEEDLLELPDLLPVR